MNFLGGLVPEIISVIAALVALFTARTFNKTYRKYSEVVSELEELESLKDAVDRLTQVREKIESASWDELMSDDSIGRELEAGVMHAVALESSRIRDYTSVSDALLDVLEKKPALAPDRIEELKTMHDYAGELLDRREALVDKLGQEIASIKKLMELKQVGG